MAQHEGHSLITKIRGGVAFIETNVHTFYFIVSPFSIVFVFCVSFVVHEHEACALRSCTKTQNNGGWHNRYATPSSVTFTLWHTRTCVSSRFTYLAPNSPFFSPFINFRAEQSNFLTNEKKKRFLFIIFIF